MMLDERGIFETIFDIDRDGKMSPAERALEMMIIDDLESEDDDSDDD